MRSVVKLINMRTCFLLLLLTTLVTSFDRRYQQHSSILRQLQGKFSTCFISGNTKDSLLDLLETDDEAEFQLRHRGGK